jgi:hypothetical protein
MSPVAFNGGELDKHEKFICIDCTLQNVSNEGPVEEAGKQIFVFKISNQILHVWKI